MKFSSIKLRSLNSGMDTGHLGNLEFHCLELAINRGFKRGNCGAASVGSIAK